MAKYYDTLLWEYIKSPWAKWLWLDKLAKDKFNYEMISYDTLTDKWKINFRDIPLDIASKYSWEDVYITRRLFEEQKKDWLLENTVLNDIEIPLLETLIDTEITWVKIDTSKLSDIWERLKIDIEKLEKLIYDLAWKEFNIKSPKQVWEVLFVDMWLPHGKKTKTGYSVDNEVLEWLAQKYDIAKYISDYRQYSKLLSTYVEWLSKIINKKTNRIHTSYNQTVTTTWRLSSTNPNLQNIPSSSWIAWEIRGAFVPFEKWDKIIAFDYSQVEVRLLAIMSEDPDLLWNFKQDLDIHATTWSFLFWKDEISNDERKIAKAVNFWVIYWISAFWLSKMIWASMAESKIYIDKFYEKYPKVREYFDWVIDFCEKNWYVETMYKRRRYIPNINDRNNIIKNSARREAMNMPIQWSAADIIKLAMIKVWEFLQKNNLKSQMIMQVHDEIVLNAKNDEIPLLKKEIPNIMENIIDAPIKLKVDMWLWDNWMEAK